MGNICCPTESPCGSAEERSVLLKDDSKTAVTSGETTVVGTCGPESDPDIRKKHDEDNMKVEVKAEAVQVKQSPKVGEKEPNNTQENGPLQKEVPQTAEPSPRKGNQENSTRAQDEEMKDYPAEGGQAELQPCTLNSLQKEKAAADWEVSSATHAATEEENPVSAQDKVPVSRSPKAEPVSPESHPETNTTKHITLDTTPDNEETGSKVTVIKAVAESSGEVSHSNEALSVPNSQLSAAACQMLSASAVSHRVAESPSRAAAEDSESSLLNKEDSPEVPRSHEASQSSPGPEPTRLDHSEDPDSSSSVREPETTAQAEESLKSSQDTKPDLDSPTLSSKDITSPENVKEDIDEEMIVKGRDKDGDVPEVKEEDETKKEAEAGTPAGKDPETQEVTVKEEQLTGSRTADVKTDETPEKEESAEDGLGDSEEDLYRGADDLPASQKDKPAVLDATLLKVEDRFSLAPAVDILSYSEREWKGNTAKSALIRKGYKEMSQRFGSLRRVRGDNYCALRATLFQVLSQSTQLPVWLQEDDITTLPKQLEAQEGLISQWRFPGECLQGDGTGDAISQLKGYMDLLRNKWRAAVDCPSAAERQQLCERAFQGGEEELGLLEALKLLMLNRAAELHGCMQGGGDVPLFCWLLFARDSSDCLRSFLSNHLSHVGLSAGLEQVEMFLLGYALRCTIQVYRLYKADTEEFVTFYPDDHKDEWPCVCLVTEDDRHYNVPVAEVSSLQKELDSS